jgi:hypothetical protein
MVDEWHQVLHSVCDDSPKYFEHKIVEIIELKINRGTYWD